MTSAFLPAQFCFIIVYIRKFESLVQIADRRAPWKMRYGVRVRVTLRLAVYRQSIRLGPEPLETHD
jgi:hypothetical protein